MTSSSSGSCSIPSAISMMFAANLLLAIDYLLFATYHLLLTT